ncbi:hypothetical protein D3C85_1942740 [compost metagenome]
MPKRMTRTISEPKAISCCMLARARTMRSDSLRFSGGLADGVLAPFSTEVVVVMLFLLLVRSAWQVP